MIKYSFSGILQKYNVLVILVAIIAFGAITNPNFIKINNILEVFQYNCELGLLSLGMTFVIISGKGTIDLTIGSLVGLSSALCGIFFINWKLGMVLSIILPFLISAFIGFLTGIIIVKGKAEPVIATFAMLIIIRGLAFLVTHGTLIIFPKEDFIIPFISIVSKKIGPIQLPTVYFIVVTAVLQFVSSYTRFGRYVYATGGNLASVRLAGINVDLFRILSFTISGSIAGLAGIITTARIYVGEPSAGMGYELVAIACVLIGGTTLDGGKGNFFRTFCGVIIIGFISNIMNLIGISVFLTDAVKGLIVLFAALIPALISFSYSRKETSL